MKVKKHFDLLGKKAKDKITGIEGIITSISFDLYGCVQCVVDRGLDKDGKKHESYWIDISRITILDINPIIKPPDFLGETLKEKAKRVIEGRSGPAEKPMRY